MGDVLVEIRNALRSGEIGHQTLASFRGPLGKAEPSASSCGGGKHLSRLGDDDRRHKRKLPNEPSLQLRPVRAIELNSGYESDRT